MTPVSLANNISKIYYFKKSFLSTPNVCIILFILSAMSYYQIMTVTPKIIDNRKEFVR